jgi:hypothetical protein
MNSGIERAVMRRTDDGRAEARAAAERQRAKADTLARFTAIEEARSRARRARRQQVEQQLRKSSELRETAERRLDACWSPMGTLLRARVI